MKRAEIVAWGATAALVAVGGILLAGGVLYRDTAYWAGMIAAFGQAVVTALAAWGLMLSRQAEELADLPPMNMGAPAMGMTFGEAPTAAPATSAARTLDTGFQRILVGLVGSVLVILAGIIYYLVYLTFAWAKANPDKAFPIAGPFDKPIPVNELGLVIGLGAAAIYLATYWVTRPRAESTVEDEAVESNFALGALGFLALGAAALLGYMNVAYAAELAASLMAFLLALQGLELLVNSLRSYSGIEELDQAAVDLQALPLVPMLASSWLGGVQLLLVESVGMGGGGGRGVAARLMPRVLVALVVLAIGASCFRSVPAGRVGILERLGTPVGHLDPNGKLVPDPLQPGLHITYPWPIDSVLQIPTGDLQYTDVGTPLRTTYGDSNVDFQFWTIGHDAPKPGQENEDEFATGDTDENGKASPQLLDTYVGIWWRVADPVKFYENLSHSDFYEKSSGETTALPIYAALVQQTAAYAVTHTFAIHPLNTILISDRAEVNAHLKKILQDKLDQANSGIEVVDLTIKDLHPPLGSGKQYDFTSRTGIRLGPADAFENVVNMSQYKERVIDQANADRLGKINRATGNAAATISNAKGQRAMTIGTAEGEAARLTTMLDQIQASPDAKQLMGLAKMNALYAALKDSITAPSKIIKDPNIDVTVWQLSDKGTLPMRPPAPQQ
ncbi:MAG TPA: SPFH domain-containing protein [Phycisphaerae bacterium]|jgi:regulator of protease activity HflC (stomatin/prohibitin superfamily)|nr:SPFH domain-containing protein [Phycisphaerae bacterium]